MELSMAAPLRLSLPDIWPGSTATDRWPDDFSNESLDDDCEAAERGGDDGEAALAIEEAVDDDGDEGE